MGCGSVCCGSSMPDEEGGAPCRNFPNRCAFVGKRPHKTGSFGNGHSTEYTKTSRLAKVNSRKCFKKSDSEQPWPTQVTATPGLFRAIYFSCVISNRGLRVCCAPRIFPAAARSGPPCCTRPKGTPKDGNPPPCPPRNDKRGSAGSGCAPGAPMVRTIKHTKFSGCRCIRYAARSTGRGLNNIFRNWRVGMSPHMPPGAQRLSNQEGPKSVTVSRFLSAFFYVKSPVRFSF